MIHSYNRGGSIARLRPLALVALLAGGATAAQGQQALPYTAPNVTNRAGTYTDLGTTGTVISTANFDDANSAAQTFFPFTYNGATYSDFVLNTNGFIKLGTTAPAAPFFSTYAQEVSTGGPLNSATETNLILPFNTDLEAGASTPEYRFAVTGTAPGRVLTIQWKNVSDKARPAAAGSGNIDKQYANFSFQVKLYETTSQIDFVYGTATPATNTVNNANFVVVGIKGSGTNANQVITAIKPSNIPWNQTTFQQGPYAAASNGVNIRREAILTGGQVIPDPGRTFSFNIPVSTDAAAQIVYAYNKLVVPAGQPTTIRALVRNAGTAALTNITATLSITGTNNNPNAGTQTVNSLAVGATAVVTFTNVAVPLPGTNTVTVTTSVAGDGNVTNNSASTAMITDPTTTSFITLNEPALSGFGTGNGNEAYFAARISFATPRDIVAVNAYIGDADPTATQKSTVGETLYGVVLDANSGAILARSPNFVVGAADVETVHSFAMSSPVTVPAGDVLIGMVQIAPASNGPLRFFPMGVQSENPTRPNTFYGGAITNGVPSAPQLALATPNNIYKYMLEAVTSAPSVCPTPTAIAVTGTPNSASISFTGPSNGTGYQVIYGPTGFNPASAGTTTPVFTTSPYTVAGLTGSTCYDFYVRANCGPTDQSRLGAATRFCTPCTPPIISTFPYTENFNTVATGQELPCGITVFDANADANTWSAESLLPGVMAGTTQPAGRGGTGNAMVYFYNEVDTTIPGDDWFYTPALFLRSGQRYRLSFYHRSAGPAYPEGLEVSYGTAATPAGQTTTIYSNANIGTTTYTQATNTSTPAVADIMPTTTGSYYIGFHAVSTAYQYYLAVDDISVSNVTTTAVSTALGKAVSVYPNPSATGMFNLEIQGANAKQALGVEVTNMLGQRVYTNTAKDNFRTELNLSSLAAGIYTLKVKNGSEYTIQQISIVK